MNDPPHTGLARRVEQRVRVIDRLPEREHPVVEPHPVGVIENSYASQGVDEWAPLVELERKGSDTPPEWIPPAGGVGQRHHLPSSLEEALRDIAP